MVLLKKFERNSHSLPPIGWRSPKALWGQLGERKRKKNKNKNCGVRCFAVFALVFLVVLLFASISARCRRSGRTGAQSVSENTAWPLLCQLDSFQHPRSSSRPSQCQANQSKVKSSQVKSGARATIMDSPPASM